MDEFNIRYLTKCPLYPLLFQVYFDSIHNNYVQQRVQPDARHAGNAGTGFLWAAADVSPWPLLPEHASEQLLPAAGLPALPAMRHTVRTHCYPQGHTLYFTLPDKDVEPTGAADCRPHHMLDNADLLCTHAMPTVLKSSIQHFIPFFFFESIDGVQKLHLVRPTLCMSSTEMHFNTKKF